MRFSKSSPQNSHPTSFIGSGREQFIRLKSVLVCNLPNIIEEANNRQGHAKIQKLLPIGKDITSPLLKRRTCNEEAFSFFWGGPNKGLVEEEVALEPVVVLKEEVALLYRTGLEGEEISWWKWRVRGMSCWCSGTLGLLDHLREKNLLCA